jgi:alpha/beta superfamily hydrolase
VTLGEPDDTCTPDFEPGEQHVFFRGDHQLEGKLGWPDRPSGCDSVPPEWVIRGGVVVAHPYPPAGATMELPVVHHIAKSCREQQFASLRFNFRSVGASLGDFSGTEEYRDVEAAVGFMSEQLAPSASGGEVVASVGLAGWSFGSVMAARAAASLTPVKALALVGFVVHWEHLPADTLDRLASFCGPVLAVCAENDHHGTPDEVHRLLRDIGLRPKIEVIERADHYLGGRERKVGSLVADFFDEVLPR